MSELSQIIGLTPEEAAAVHERAVAGDAGALRTFCLHSAWMKIKAEKRYSDKAKIEALRYVIKNHAFRMATPEDEQEARKARLVPMENPTAPWWGSGPPPPDAPNAQEGA